MPCRSTSGHLIKVRGAECLVRHLGLREHWLGARLLLQREDPRGRHALTGRTSLRDLSLKRRSRHVHLVQAHRRSRLWREWLSILLKLRLELHLHLLWHLELEVLLHLRLDLQLDGLLNLGLHLGEDLGFHLLVDDGLLVLRLLTHLLPNHLLCHLADFLVEQLEPGEAVLVLRLHGFPPLLLFGQLLAKSHVHLLQLLLQI